MAGLTECTFINACIGKIEMISDYAIDAEDNGWTFLMMFCMRESLCIYQTKLMYNDKILKKGEDTNWTMWYFRT